MPDVDEAISEAVHDAVADEVEEVAEEVAAESADEGAADLVNSPVVVAVDESPSPMEEVAAGLDVVSQLSSLVDQRIQQNNEVLLTSVADMITVAMATQAAATPPPVVVEPEEPLSAEDDEEPEPSHWFYRKRGRH